MRIEGSRLDRMDFHSSCLAIFVRNVYDSGTIIQLSAAVRLDKLVAFLLLLSPPSSVPVSAISARNDRERECQRGNQLRRLLRERTLLLPLIHRRYELNVEAVEEARESIRRCWVSES